MTTAPRPDLAEVLADQGYERVSIPGPPGRVGERWKLGAVSVTFGCGGCVTIRTPDDRHGLTNPTVPVFLAALVEAERSATVLLPQVAYVVRYGPLRNYHQADEFGPVEYDQDADLAVVVTVAGQEWETVIAGHEGGSDHYDVMATVASAADQVHGFMVDVGVPQAAADNWAQLVAPFAAQWAAA